MGAIVKQTMLSNFVKFQNGRSSQINPKGTNGLYFSFKFFQIPK